MILSGLSYCLHNICLSEIGRSCPASYPDLVSFTRQLCKNDVDFQDEFFETAHVIDLY